MPEESLTLDPPTECAYWKYFWSLQAAFFLTRPHLTREFLCISNDGFCNFSPCPPCKCVKYHQWGCSPGPLFIAQILQLCLPRVIEMTIGQERWSAPYLLVRSSPVNSFFFMPGGAGNVCAVIFTGHLPFCSQGALLWVLVDLYMLTWFRWLVAV